jgi:hypothetical protein
MKQNEIINKKRRMCDRGTKGKQHALIFLFQGKIKPTILSYLIRYRIENKGCG